MERKKVDEIRWSDSIKIYGQKMEIIKNEQYDQIFRKFAWVVVLYFEWV